MQPKLAHWLQPHVIVELSNEAKSEWRSGIGSRLLLRTNPSPGRPPLVRIYLKPTETLPQPSRDAENAYSSRTKVASFGSGLPVSSSVCFSSEARTAFAANYDKEQRPCGGTVLRTRVQIDTATALCDAVFDRAFDGIVYYRVPDFPTSLMLPGALKVEASSPKKDCSTDNNRGHDRLNRLQQSPKQPVIPTDGAATAHENAVPNSEHKGYESEGHHEPMSKAQRKKAQKKLARAQAKARAKALVEVAGVHSHESSHPQEAPYAHLKATDAPESTPLPSGTSQRIGIIVGPSGCAKSVLLRLYFGWPVDISPQGMNVWDASASIWSQFPVTAHAEPAVEEAFEAVGLLHLQSPQHRNERMDCSWLKSMRYSELSQGEQYLCNVAYLLIHCQLHRAASASTAEQNDTDACGVGKTYAEHWRGSGVFLLDEFTSCLDRQSARRLGAGLCKYCRKHAEVLPRVVVAGCHRDVIAPDAFVPDWVFEADTMTLHHLDFAAAASLSSAVASNDMHSCSTEECGDRLGARAAPKKELERVHELFHVPVIKLRLRACSPATWRDFRVHHYKTQTLSQKARTFALTLESLHYSSDGSADQHGDKHASASGIFEGICSANCPVGFVATIPQSGSGVSDLAPSISTNSEGSSIPIAGGSTAAAANADATTSHRRAEAWRAHRTVVLPAWQGLGVGSRLSDAAAALHHREGCEYYGQTVHPRFGAYRDASPLWQPTLWNHSTQRFKIESWKQRTANIRVRLRTPRYVYSHYFVGATREADDPASAALAARVVFDGETGQTKGEQAGGQ
jgi:GNAT superfamily N-acetyltransferase